ncbi:ROK family protein [Endozoicomonas elysicola]|uniref:N-acetylglucosamine kinase n=1 Tax=Endozoicomonas elysicola TaxID=305900 RepID=A0A081KFR2_9GAMM|nr:ROK family protein [Endozoicomonas elysicola]KEI72988.1 hypothetical protein GV64_21725 [Endozoicomonas elysicola]
MVQLYGFDIGGTKIEFAVFNQKMEILHVQRMETPKNDYALFLKVITDFIGNQDLKSGELGTIGIGLPGQQIHGGITRCNNIPCIDGRYLQADLEEIVGRPVKIANDANCFALSESFEKSLITSSSVLALILGTGFGAGLVINGDLYEGHNGASLEVGHMRLPCDAQELLGNTVSLVKCRCGQTGCLDHYLSGRGFADLYNHRYSSSDDHVISAEEITRRYYQGDHKAQIHINEYLELLAMSISGLLVVLDPEVVVFGGGLSNFNAIYDKLPELLKKYTLNNRPIPSIRKAAFGDSGGVRGAALLNVTDDGLAAILDS